MSKNNLSLKIAEENNRKEKLEQGNVTKKEREIEFQDLYIGLFLNDRYKLVKRIGKGSFGLVYLVDDTKIDANK